MLRPLVLALAFLALGRAARAEPGSPGFLYLHSPRVACLGVLPALTDCITLPTGYFLDEPTYGELDAELKRLQDLDTRLTAENASLRVAAASWGPGWVTLTTTLVVGLVVGVSIAHLL